MRRNETPQPPTDDPLVNLMIAVVKQAQVEAARGKGKVRRDALDFLEGLRGDLQAEGIGV